MAKLRGKVLHENSFRERLYENPVGNVWVTEDGAPPLPSAPTPVRTHLALTACLLASRLRLRLIRF